MDVNLPPPRINNENPESSSGSTTIGSTPFIVTITDPTKTDSITSWELRDGQAIRLTGFPDPANPLIDIPNTTEYTSANGAKVYNLTVKDDQGNPWFIPSYLAAVHAVVMFMLKNAQSTRWQESQAALHSREAMYEMAKTQAELTRESFNLQAQEKMIEAISCFVSAGMSAFSALETAGTATRARKQAEAEYEQNLNSERAKATQLRQQANNLNDEFVSMDEASLKANNLVPGKTPAEVKVAQQRADAQDARVKQMIDDREIEVTKRTSVLQNYNTEMIRLRTDMLKQIAEGTFKALESTLIKSRGVVEEEIKVNEANMGALRSYQETSEKERDEIRNSIKQIIDDFIQQVHMVNKAFSLHTQG